MTKRQERERGRVSELELFIIRESSSLSSSRRRRARERERKRKSMRQKRKKQHTCIAANYCATGTEYNRRRTTTNAKMYARTRAVRRRRRRRRRLIRTPNARCCEKIKNVYNIILIHKAFFYGNLVRTGSLYSLESIGCASLRWKMVNEF
jgi:hypothetical protein